MSTNSLSCTVADGIATLTMHRESTSNAIDVDVIRSMHLALDEVQKGTQKGEGGVRAVVITGSDDVFCSGLDLHTIDLNSPETRQRPHFETRRFMDPLILRLSAFRFPIVAAVNGAAVGLGGGRPLVWFYRPGSSVSRLGHSGQTHAATANA